MVSGLFDQVDLSHVNFSDLEQLNSLVSFHSGQFTFSDLGGRIQTSYHYQK